MALPTQSQVAAARSRQQRDAHERKFKEAVLRIGAKVQQGIADGSIWATPPLTWEQKQAIQDAPLHELQRMRKDIGDLSALESEEE